MSPAKRGITTIEYAFLIIAVVAGLIGMAVYLRRAVSGGLKEAGDAFGHGRQYEPGVTQPQ